ncbi:hypothetical protein SCP_0903040 [Sparassis crispa]|uniref:Uncharacterized protein n=1 Tax=Sparassis crispa TaxID=139825 RepID=A0A401GW33_9APHY|nr:hypothetical protein SCP_0903040 [Sparassis crispa]GBE86425.1 hypothetical protein SCP_0903040 [Sparassis crispa]
MDHGFAKHLATWKAYGTVFTLQMLHNGWGPSDVSPFLIMALLSIDETLVVDETIVHFFDKEGALKLLPWLRLGLEAELDADISTFLVEEVDTDPQVDPAAVEGISLGQCGESTMIVSFYNCFQVDQIPAAIGAMYNTQVSDVDQVIKVVSVKYDTENRYLHCFQRLFFLHFERYLHGREHLAPQNLTAAGLISEQAHRDHEEDSLLRSKLLLRSILDSELLPVDGS